MYKTVYFFANGRFLGINKLDGGLTTPEDEGRLSLLASLLHLVDLTEGAEELTDLF